MFAQGLTLATVLTAAYVSRNGHQFRDVEDALHVCVFLPFVFLDAMWSVH